MKCLLYVSILLAFLSTGCVAIKPAKVTPDSSPHTINRSAITKYKLPVKNHLFKATVDIKKHHLTGLLVIKNMDSTKSSPVYRIVFVNEIGMTFFDLEMKTDSFKVVSCFTSLNKKALMKIFETDFRMLLLEGSLKNEKNYRQAGTNNMVISGNAGKYKIWQTLSASGDTLFTTAAKSNMADPAIINFSNYLEGFPKKITIENPFIGMKLSLKMLSQ